MKDSESYMFGILREHLEKPDFTMDKVWPLIQYSPLKRFHLKEFCEELLKREKEDLKSQVKKAKKDPNYTILTDHQVDFDEIKEISDSIEVSEEKKERPSWKDWPENVKNEIRYILGENDSGRRKISMSDYIKRMREDFEMDVSDHGVKAFCKSLGRRGWTK